MDLTEWIISGALILVVLTQIRGRKLTLVGLLWPLPLVAWGAVKYLGGVPAHSADWLLVTICFAAGLALGTGCGLLTEVYADGGVVKARARWLAAILWLVGMSSRLAFGLYATNGGGAKVMEVSSRLGLQSANTWASALIAMALVEVLARSVVLFARSHKFRHPASRLGDSAPALAATAGVDTIRSADRASSSPQNRP